LGLEDRLVLYDRDDHATANNFLDFRERTLRSLAGGELDDGDVFLLQFGAELQITSRDDDRLGRRVHGLHRLVLHEVVGAVRQPASGENGNGEDCKDSAAHWFTYSFRMSADDCIVRGAPTVELRRTSLATGPITMNWNG